MNEFEKVSDEVNGEQTFDSFGEFAIEWVRYSKTATVTFPNATKFNSKIRKLAEEHPDEVKIRHINADGSLVATIPVSYIKISPKRAGREMTEEEIEAARERMSKLHEMQREKRLGLCNSDT